MRYLPLLILIILSASCCRFIPQKCITHTTDTLTVVKYDTIIEVRDTTIIDTLYLPGDTVYSEVEKPVQVDPDGLIQSDSLIMETAFAKAWAIVDDSRLHGELIQKDTLLQLEILLEGVIRETTILRDSITVINNETTLIKKQATKKSFIFISIIIILSLILAIKLIRR